MSHATLLLSFISPAQFLPAGVEAEAAFSLLFSVSATYPRLLTVYSCVSGFVQNAHSNLTHWLHSLPLHVSFVRRKVKRNGEALQCPTKVLKDLTK
ncbi:hypothetical protein FHS77_002705 [Paenochrobactrum gallinarii]|uniref:Uncharacterized protein n=1 Tax=Paenochrobactrum gallinarii TaxID=643673 RepID=A0A841M062_9HYPH|nr:hypothetical protein [Paenochrobactrum gallinarii]MBB6262137.1 hypothetical protein [Paenochrobactrum gallinarii]